LSTQPSSWINLPQRLRDPVLAFLEAFRQFGCNVRVALPGIVKSFNATAQTVVVQLAINEVLNVNTADGQGNVVPVPTPTTIDLISDVPVAFTGGGGFTVCPPIAEGDECLVVFADNCINAWWANGGVQNQEVKRRHNLSDGFALVGLRSQPRKLSSYNTSALQIRSDNGETFVEVGAAEIKLNATNVTVNGTLTVNGNISQSSSYSATFSGTSDFGGSATFTGTTTIQGYAFLTHVHSGVQTGSGDTGPVT
jgi:hypothetical protein